MKFIDNSKSVLIEFEKAMQRALTQIGIEGKNNVRDKIQEKDIIDTGELYRTIGFNVREIEKEVNIGSPKDYAKYQELGTRRQPARSFIKDGLMHNISKYKQIVEDEFESLTD